jgi:hypothetical protein
MPLLDKLNDSKLKYLKFGQNRTPSDSTVPYIVTDINSVNSVIADNLTRNDNGLLRGGVSGSSNASLIDGIRILKFLKDPLKGEFFINKQNKLQLSNPKVETNIGDPINGYTRIYNKDNIIRQTLNLAQGYHYPRHGTDNINIQGKYEDVIKSNIGYTGNRLYKYYIKLFDKSRNNPDIRYANNQSIIDEYNGGPNSLYGVGKTTIFRSVYSGDEKDIKESINRSKYKLSTGVNIMYNTYSVGLTDNDFSIRVNNILPKTSILGGYIKDGKLMDYKKEIKPIPLNRNFPPVYKNFKKDKKKSLTLSTEYRSRFDPENKDALIHNRARLRYDRKDSSILNVKFYQIDPFTGRESKAQIFSGYINGYNENYSSNWNDIKYNGRATFLYNFVSYKKTASFNLQIPIFDVSKLDSTYEDLEKLKKGLEGTYDNNSRLGGIITKIKLGYYLNYQYCIITSLTIKIPDEASWDWSDSTNSARSTLLEASFNVTIIDDKISV